MRSICSRGYQEGLWSSSRSFAVRVQFRVEGLGDAKLQPSVRLSLECFGVMWLDGTGSLAGWMNLRPSILNPRTQILKPAASGVYTLYLHAQDRSAESRPLLVAVLIVRQGRASEQIEESFSSQSSQFMKPSQGESLCGQIHYTGTMGVWCKEIRCGSCMKATIMLITIAWHMHCSIRW